MKYDPLYLVYSVNYSLRGCYLPDNEPQLFPSWESADKYLESILRDVLDSYDPEQDHESIEELEQYLANYKKEKKDYIGKDVTFYIGNYEYWIYSETMKRSELIISLRYSGGLEDDINEYSLWDSQSVETE